MNSNLKKMEIRSYSIKKSQHANKEPTKNSNLSFRQGLSQILRGQNFELFRKSKCSVEELLLKKEKIKRQFKNCSLKLPILSEPPKPTRCYILSKAVKVASSFSYPKNTNLEVLAKKICLTRQHYVRTEHYVQTEHQIQHYVQSEKYSQSEQYTQSEHNDQYEHYDQMEEHHRYVSITFTNFDTRELHMAICDYLSQLDIDDSDSDSESLEKK